MPENLTVYEPRITFDGTTTTLTYDVKLDVSDDDDEVIYTAQKPASDATDATPQSIEALILQYGVQNGLFGESPVTSVTKGGEYPLAPKDVPYVIIPLETDLIREYLLEICLESATNNDNNSDPVFPNLVWVEENPAIGPIDPVLPAEGNWTEGTYVATGIRISGLAMVGTDPTLGFAGTIDNFGDGGKVEPGQEESATRIPSIATVLADDYVTKNDRYISTINFYVDGVANTILANLKDGDWKDGTGAQKWMKTSENKPTLRIVYQWAE
jgi:hypothetical protein